MVHAVSHYVPAIYCTQVLDRLQVDIDCRTRLRSLLHRRRRGEAPQSGFPNVVTLNRRTVLRTDVLVPRSLASSPSLLHHKPPIRADTMVVKVSAYSDTQHRPADRAAPSGLSSTALPVQIRHGPMPSESRLHAYCTALCIHSEAYIPPQIDAHHGRPSGHTNARSGTCFSHIESSVTKRRWRRPVVCGPILTSASSFLQSRLLRWQCSMFGG